MIKYQASLKTVASFMQLLIWFIQWALLINNYFVLVYTQISLITFIPVYFSVVTEKKYNNKYIPKTYLHGFIFWPLNSMTIYIRLKWNYFISLFLLPSLSNIKVI